MEGPATTLKPIFDVPLVGEYVWHKLVKASKAIGSGFEMEAEGELAKAEWFEKMSPRMRECAADFTCATLVSAHLHVIALYFGPLFGPQAVGSLEAIAFAWDVYAVALQTREANKPVYEAVPQ